MLPLPEEGPVWAPLPPRTIPTQPVTKPIAPATCLCISNNTQAKPNTHWMFLLLAGQWTLHRKMPVSFWQRRRSADFQGLTSALISPCSPGPQNLEGKSDLRPSQMRVNLYPQGIPSSDFRYLFLTLQSTVFWKHNYSLKTISGIFSISLPSFQAH